MYHQGQYDVFALVAVIEENEVRPIQCYSCVKSCVVVCLFIVVNEKCDP